MWAAGVTLWALVGAGFPFLYPAEECLGRVVRMAAMAPRIIAGAPRPLPHQVPTPDCVWLQPQHEACRCRLWQKSRAE